MSLIFIYSCNTSDDEIIIDEPPLIDIYEEDTSFKSVGYLPSYRFSLADQIHFDQVTYVNLALVLLGDGRLKNFVKRDSKPLL